MILLNTINYMKLYNISTVSFMNGIGEMGMN